MWALFLKNLPALAIGAVAAFLIVSTYDLLWRVPAAKEEARAEIKAETLARATDLVRDLDKTKAAVSSMTDAQLCEKLKGMWNVASSTCN